MNPNVILAAMGLKGAHGIGKNLVSGIQNVQNIADRRRKLEADAKLYAKAKNLLYKPGNAEEQEAFVGGQKGLDKLKKVGINPNRFKIGQGNPVKGEISRKQALPEQMSKKLDNSGAKMQKGLHVGVSKMPSTMNPMQQFGDKLGSYKAKQEKNRISTASKLGNPEKAGKVLGKMGLSADDIGPKKPKI